MTDWTEQELEIFEQFHWRCIRCPRKAVTLHEIVPKSKRPKDWDDPENRVPICNECHRWAHDRGTRSSEQELRRLRQRKHGKA
jgi:5-methylcytosine-specific restriction endonuclease McrA